MMACCHGCEGAPQSACMQGDLLSALVAATQSMTSEMMCTSDRVHEHARPDKAASWLHILFTAAITCLQTRHLPYEISPVKIAWMHFVADLPSAPSVSVLNQEHT